MENAAELEAVGLVKRYRRERAALDGVSLRARSGQIVGLLGPNGAGKTTCFGLLAGVLRADAGVVRLDGEDVTSLPLYLRARRGLSYLPQESAVFTQMSALENVRAALEIRGLRGREAATKAATLLEEMGVLHLAQNPAEALSGGEKRRVEIARLLAVEPRFVLLDEPFSAIEPRAVAELQTLIVGLARRGIGICLTDHNAREALRICDRACVLHEGRILCEGTPAEIARDPAARRAYLGGSFVLD